MAGFILRRSKPLPSHFKLLFQLTLKPYRKGMLN